MLSSKRFSRLATLRDSSKMNTKPLAGWGQEFSSSLYEIRLKLLESLTSLCLFLLTLPLSVPLSLYAFLSRSPLFMTVFWFLCRKICLQLLLVNGLLTYFLCTLMLCTGHICCIHSSQLHSCYTTDANLLLMHSFMYSISTLPFSVSSRSCFTSTGSCLASLCRVLEF